MQERSKRFFNFRPMCLFAVALIVGIIIGECLYGVHSLFRLIPFFLIVATFVVFVLIKRLRRFAFAFVGILIGFLGISFSSDIYNKNTSIGEYEGYIYAKVSSQVIVEDGRTKFYIQDVYAGDESLKYDAYVIAYIEDEPDYNAGDIVKIYGTLKARTHTRFDSFHAYDVAKREGFIVYSYQSVEKLSEGKLHPLQRIPYKMKSNFYERMDEDSAAICTALVLGDKTGLDDELHANISASGLAHVLAVSGLHISTVSAALFFVLRKIKLNPRISVFVVAALMVFYCFLCDFTASSLRALITMSVLNFSIAFGKKRDSLSTISFAAVILLFFRPTALMEAGFLMSFSAVLGITLFYSKFYHSGMKVIDKVSPKRHFGRHIAMATALSLSANILTFPFIAYFYGQVTILFVLSNIVVLPYLMLIYIFLLINTVFVLIVGWTGPLVMFKYLLVPFKGYVAIFGSLRFATLPVVMTIAGIAGIVFLCFFLSRFVFAKRLTKVFGTVVISVLTVVLSLIEVYADKKIEERRQATSELTFAVQTDDYDLSTRQGFDVAEAFSVKRSDF